MENGRGGLTVCDGLVAEANAVQNGVFCEGEQIVWHDIVTSLQERPRAARLNQ